MKNKLLQKAKYKLTAYYVFIMTIVLVIFSGALIYTVDRNLEENLSGKVIIVGKDENPIEEATDDIEKLIYYVDGILILLISYLSYFLAGKTLKPIQDNIDLQKKFSTEASHDLRTPLSIIISESEVALYDKNKKDEKNFKSVVLSNLEEARKMSYLVNDLLIISRDENRIINNKFVYINLHFFVEKIVSKLKNKAEKKGLNLTINDHKKILIKVDISNFERAILNILQNSIYYTNKGSIYVEVTSNDDYAFIIITDTGVGINEVDLPYIFDRFYKAEHSRNHESGSGLGLSISKQIIDQHKGSIDIESKVNNGTKVTIKIPKNI